MTKYVVYTCVMTECLCALLVNMTGSRNCKDIIPVLLLRLTFGYGKIMRDI